MDAPTHCRGRHREQTEDSGVTTIDRYDVFVRLDVEKVSTTRSFSTGLVGARPLGCFRKTGPASEQSSMSWPRTARSPVVNQPATIGPLPVAVPQAQGDLVSYLPGLAMRRIADWHPGEAKTNAQDAAIIVETVRKDTGHTSFDPDR